MEKFLKESLEVSSEKVLGEAQEELLEKCQILGLVNVGTPERIPDGISRENPGDILRRYPEAILVILHGITLGGIEMSFWDYTGSIP